MRLCYLLTYSELSCQIVIHSALVLHIKKVRIKSSLSLISTKPGRHIEE
jgi:hypothetical protein